MRTWILAVRTTPARFLFPILLGFQLCVLFYFSGSEWRMEWRWAIDWAGAAIPFVGPVLAGFAAWRSQYVRARFGELLGASRGGARAYAFEFAGAMTWAGASQLVTVCVASVAVVLAGAAGFPPLVVLVWQLATLAGYLGLGYAVGQLSYSRLLPPVVTVGLFFASVQSANGSLPTLWFEVGGATASLAGLTWNPEVVVAQTVLGVSLALLPFVVVRPVSRVVVRASIGVVALVAVVGSLSTLASSGEDRFAYASDSGRVCSGHDPEVCLLPENTPSHTAVDAVFRSLSDAAGGPGGGAPAKFVQALGGRQTSEPGQEFVLNGGTVTPDGADPVALVHYFAWNRDCLWSDEAPPLAARNALDQLQQVLLVRAHFLPADGASSDVAPLLRQPEAVQRDWITRTLALSESCAFAQLAPWGP
ncbi:hypothetical protein [Cellulomonas sp. URHD0024]|uniref:hypothetical protein n=1 Tax=Cellulomonas sp. URHD0024 TaxID=1302620 RepID=UPI00041456CA|nr:hypothetical protein [Cellulomonas sp. URHD0024]